MYMPACRASNECSLQASKSKGMSFIVSKEEEEDFDNDDVLVVLVVLVVVLAEEDVDEVLDPLKRRLFFKYPSSSCGVCVSSSFFSPCFV